MRRTLAAAGCALTLALGLAACGESAPQGQRSKGAPPAATSTPAAASTATLGSMSGSSSPAATSEQPPPGLPTPGENGTGVNGATSESSAAARRSTVPADQPARLSMPSIGFDRAVRGLGVNAQGQISPPAGTTQWYDKSVIPGQPGISVIAGHVTYNGPDVFYRLDRLAIGDTVTVAYGNGSSKAFKVYAEEAINKKTLQSDPRVWGSSTTPVLALITCDAASRLIGNHHVDNYVVWAAPA